MHVYQPAHLVIGIVLLGFGLLATLVTLYHYLTSSRRKQGSEFGGWLYLYLALLAPSDISEAFDPRGHESFRTAVVTWATMPLALMLFLFFFLLPKLRQRRRSRTSTAGQEP